MLQHVMDWQETTTRSGDDNVFLKLGITGTSIAFPWSPFANSKEVVKDFVFLDWSCKAKYQTNYHHVGGMNSTWHHHVENATKHAIDPSGFLILFDLTKDDNETICRIRVQKEMDTYPELEFRYLLQILDRTVDGSWSPWSNWGHCPISCGGGEQRRTRTCSNPPAAFGGKPCTGDSLESRTCNSEPCPVHGNWSCWSDWSDCTATCIGGVQIRTRACINPSPAFGGKLCHGPWNETRECNGNPCPVNGSWSPWSNWGHCPISCGGGEQRRTRTCSNPPAAFGGKPCTGDSLESRTCNTEPCPGNTQRDVTIFTVTSYVRPGTNRLTLTPYENALELKKKVEYISWYKLQGENKIWLGGASIIENQWEVQMANSTDGRYTIYPIKGTLQVENVSKDDDGDLYMGTVTGGYRGAIQYRLQFFDPKAGDPGTTGWKIGFFVLLVFVIIETIFLIWRGILSIARRQSTDDQNAPSEAQRNVSISGASHAEESVYQDSDTQRDDRQRKKEDGMYIKPSSLKYSVPEATGNNEAFLPENGGIPL